MFCSTRNQDRIRDMTLWDEPNVELGAKVCTRNNIFGPQFISINMNFRRKTFQQCFHYTTGWFALHCITVLPSVGMLWDDVSHICIYP